jgi:hypothetical protein
MLAGLNLWKKNLLRMRNPQKLLEKSKNLELNPRDFGLNSKQIDMPDLL